MFDTQDSIADLGIFLEASPTATDKDQHIAGVPWLAERVRSGDLAWLLTTHTILATESEHFDAIGTLSGELLHQNVPHGSAGSDRGLAITMVRAAVPVRFALQ